MGNEIVKAGNNIITTMDDAERAAKAMAASGYFADAKQAAQAIVKVLAGHEMGFGPFASMTGIYIIQGRPAIGANLMAAAVKASPRYDYRVKEMSNERCVLAFFEGGQPIGESEFTLADAKAAGTKNLDKFPRNMLFARAMSNGVRWYCPDVFSGSAVYTPEELGAVVDGEGNVVSAPEIEVSAPDPEDPPADDGKMTLAEAEETTTKKGTRFADLTRNQLETVLEARSTTKREKRAAAMLLAELDRMEAEELDAAELEPDEPDSDEIPL